MVLAGILSKYGAYGLLLMFLLLPASLTYANYLAVLFGFSALYCAVAALRQPNIKRLTAYAGAVGMGIASIGLASANAFGTAGALYALLGNGIAMSMMFLLAATIDESFGTPMLERVKGMLRDFPALAYSFIFDAFAVIGIPLTAGFIGYLLVFSGAFKAYGFVSLIPLAALVLLGASLFYVIERSFTNVSAVVEPYQNPRRSVYVAIGLLTAATLLFGILPSLLLSPFAI